MLHKINRFMVDAVFLKHRIVAMTVSSQFGVRHLRHLNPKITLNFVDLESTPLVLLCIHNVCA